MAAQEGAAGNPRLIGASSNSKRASLSALLVFSSFVSVADDRRSMPLSLLSALLFLSLSWCSFPFVYLETTPTSDGVIAPTLS